MLVPDVSKIAVLRANALGDYVFCLPALESLRVAYPYAEIVLLGAPWHDRFLAGRPGPVDRVMVVPAVPGIRRPVPKDPMPPETLETFAAKARGEGFDLALQLHGGGRNSNPLVVGLGARVSAGLRAPDAPALDRWIPYAYYQPEVFRYLEVVGLVGAPPVSYEPRLRPTAAERAEAGALVGEPDTPWVVLHPGATDPRRRWPPERFAAVGDAASGAGARVLITGTPSEAELVETVRTAMRAPARSLVGALSTGGLVALLADSAVVVANDTGPLHVAAAAGAATVGLFWVGNFINGAPVSRARHRPLVSWTIHCPDCGADCTRDLYPARTGGPPCRHAPSFVADIPVAEVVAETLDLLRTRP
jgi:ADP-heptose:LPS heptosyltransferase